MFEALRGKGPALIFNGRNIDKLVDGYLTVNVEGRQLFAPSLDLLTVPGRDGDLVLESVYPARDIKVHFVLYAKDNGTFLSRVRELTSLLQSEEEVAFSFADEEGKRYGRLSDFEDPPYDSNVGQGTFIIHCSDPFLYKDQKTVVNRLPDIKYRSWPLDLVQLAYSLPADSKSVVFKNLKRGTRIVINGDFRQGQEVKVTAERITVSGQNRTSRLDFATSDFHDFRIFCGDSLEASPRADVRISYRERIL